MAYESTSGRFSWSKDIYILVEMVIGERVRMRALPEEFLLGHLDLGDLSIGGLVCLILILEIATVFLALSALCGNLLHFGGGVGQ